MKRAIIVPAAPAPEALAELKQWLAITTTGDDASLQRLVAVALELGESFTGSMLLESTCEELVPASGDWQSLCTRPVQAVVAVEAVTIAGQRALLDVGAYSVELLGDGGARVRLTGGAAEARQLAVRFIAGLASSWAMLPDGLRHGVIRCAAHLHRQSETGTADALPAAVAALWRPWRRMRLA